MNIHGGVSARCFITSSLRAPVACSVSASVLRLVLFFFFSTLASWSGSRRVNQYATPHRALLIFRSFLTHANIFADRSANIFPIHAASHDDNDTRADRYNDEINQNRLKPCVSVSILIANDWLVKYGDKSINVNSDEETPVHIRQARLWNISNAEIH